MFEAQVGIDFGSAGSGYSFSFCNEDKIYHSEIFGAKTDCKVPTEIVLNDYGGELCFGEGCTKYLKDNGLKSGHLFKHIKMNLYSKNKKDTFIKSVNTGRSFSLVNVIQKVLESLKNSAIKQIRGSRPGINESNIKWTVTVPAIWEERQKDIMMEACKNAGLVNEKTDLSVFLTLEPEAASLYCLRKGEIDPDFIQDGDYYIVCDLGGGTGDIVTHKIGNNKKVKEVESACGGDYGSNEINKKIFSDIIYKIFGFKDFDSLQKKYRQLPYQEGEKGEKILFGDWNELEREINELKEGANIDNYEEGKQNINLSLFKDFFEEGIDLENLINKYNKNVQKDCKLIITSKRKWNVDFPYKIIYNYINSQSQHICDSINNIINKNENIKTIIFVGGYSLNDILISLIKEKLSKKRDFNFFRPPRPFLAVMEGSVIFGINPQLIYSRKAKYTIGTDVRLPWNEEVHSKLGKKQYDESENKYYCRECFSKFVKVDENIEIDQEITQSFIMNGPRYCNIGFYASLKPNPTFTFEEGVDKIGECQLDAGKDYPVGEREITITMKYGGTKYLFKTKHTKSGKELQTNLIYE